MIGFKNWATILVEASNSLPYRVLLVASWPSATAVVLATTGLNVEADDFRLWNERYQPSLHPSANAPTAAEKLFYRLGEGIPEDLVGILACPFNCIPKGTLIKIANIIIDGDSIAGIQSDLEKFRDTHYPDTPENANKRQQVTNIRDHVGPGPLDVPVHAFFPCGEKKATPLY